MSALAALLRGEPVAWREGVDASTLVDAARHQGVAPLLDVRFAGGLADDWPEEFRRACHEDALAHAASDLMSQSLLREVLATLATSGIDSVILKGTALAYSHYPSPALRPRVDCDLLVAPRNRDAAARILNALGYVRASGPAGKYVGYQMALVRSHLGRATHCIDLHWRVSDVQSFAWLFTFEELFGASVDLPALGPSARRPSDMHCLLIALLHRAGNNLYEGEGFGDRLIWLYDFHVLLQAMSDAELSRFLRLASEKRVVALALDGLRSCADYFPSARMADAIAALERSPDDASASAKFMRASRFRREWLELRAVPTNRARMAYLAARLCPSAHHLRERYPEVQDRTLIELHVRRWLEGAGLARRRV